MVVVKSYRPVAVVLFLVAFLALVGSRAFPFMDDISGVVKTAVAILGAVCALAGVFLWLRRPPRSET